MAHIISFANQKGGVSKTTTAVNLAAGLHNKGYKVLLIDLDSQANATQATDLEGYDVRYTITDELSGEVELKDSIVRRDDEYDIIASDELLSGYEAQALENWDILKSDLAAVKKEYDYIIIDTKPALGNLLLMALKSSDYVVIPMEARPFAEQGLAQLNQTIQAVRSRKKPVILGILLTKFHERTVLNRLLKENLEAEAKELNTSLFNTQIRESIAVPESQLMKQAVVDYAPKSNPALDYVSFTEEVIRKIEGDNHGK